MDVIPWKSDALPVLRNAGRFPLGPADTMAYRSTTHAIHIHQYHAEITLGGKRLTLQPGDLTVSPANVESTYALPKPGHHWCVHLMPWEGVDPDVHLPLHAPLGALAEHAGEKIMSIARLLSANDRLSRAGASAAALELILWLAVQTTQPLTTSPTRVRRAVEQVADIIHQRFAEPLFMPDLADMVQMSQNHLAKHFRARFGMTVQRYLLARRIDAARHLLTATMIPVHRVATRVGIDDAQYFNKQFRRVVGMSPSRYRQSGGR